MDGVDSIATFPMTIGRLAKYANCSIDMIRYYEEIGLLPAAPRTAGKHRFYQQEHLTRLRFVRQCRALDFSLIEIEQLLQLVYDSDGNCAEIGQLFESHLIDIRRSIDHLRKVEALLQALTTHCSAKTSSGCPAIKLLLQQYVEDLQPLRISVAANLNKH